MSSNNQLKFILPLLSITVLLIFGSNYYLYNKLTDEYSNQVTSLNQKIDSLEKDLNDQVEYEKKLRSEQLKQLDQKASNIEKNLESQVNDVSSNIEEVRSNTEQNLQDISNKVGGIEKKSSLLENKLSQIEVSSSDFSSIIEDVVKTVVSVRTNLGQGSGVIIDSRGYIVTSDHVIDGATEINVIDYSGGSYSATLVRRDTNLDLAVLLVNSVNSFSYLQFEDEGNIGVGDRVIAVGNPLGLAFSVTEGIISAENRHMDDSGIGYLQTDVSINPGNSGGPLVNSGKKIVGIATKKIVNTEGLGFAIPSNIVKNFVAQSLP